jgi:hypothetical protein
VSGSLISSLCAHPDTHKCQHVGPHQLVPQRPTSARWFLVSGLSALLVSSSPFAYIFTNRPPQARLKISLLPIRCSAHVPACVARRRTSHALATMRSSFPTSSSVGNDSARIPDPSMEACRGQWIRTGSHSMFLLLQAHGCSSFSSLLQPSYLSLLYVHGDSNHTSCRHTDNGLANLRFQPVVCIV